MGAECFNKAREFCRSYFPDVCFLIVGLVDILKYVMCVVWKEEERFWFPAVYKCISENFNIKSCRRKAFSKTFMIIIVIIYTLSLYIVGEVGIHQLP